MTEIFHISDIDLETLEAERKRALSLTTQAVPANRIHEVGSTAIEGLIGKQDLDFLVLAPVSEFLEYRTMLDGYFSRNANQMSNNVYQGYKVDSDHDVAIQLTVEGGPYDTFLEFLEQLRRRPELREAYNQLKRSFNGLAMSEYREAKRKFIEDALASSEGH